MYMYVHIIAQHFFLVENRVTLFMTGIHTQYNIIVEHPCSVSKYPITTKDMIILNFHFGVVYNAPDPFSNTFLLHVR